MNLNLRMNNKISSNNNFFNTVLNYVVEVLFVSNLWIFLFNFLLKFFNHKFPIVQPTNFVIPGVSPEPFEIPLYLLLSFFTVFIIFFLHKIIYQKFNFLTRFKTTTMFIVFKLVFLIFLFLVFINNLGDYPMGKDIFPLTNIENNLTNYIYLFGYLIFTGLVIFESNWLKYLIHKKNFFILFYTSLLLFIGFLTLRPGFPISWHDYPYIYGPVSEIAQGKTIYTQAQSQYGFLLVLVLAFLSNLHLINLTNLPILIWIFYIVEYFLCYYLIFKLSRSFVLAFIGLFSIITINFYSLCCTIAFPQIGPLRWLPIIFLIFLLYKFKKIDNYWFIFILSLLSFWMVDAGIAILMAYTFSLLILALAKVIDFKRLIKDYFLLGLTVVGIFLLIDFIGILFGYQLINPISIFTIIREYSRAGFGMLPIATKTFFWLTLVIYFASLVYFFQKKRYSSNEHFILFIANLTLFVSVYFVGRSHPLNLFVTATFPLLTLFILIAHLYTNKTVNKSPKFKVVILITSFLLLVAYPAFARKEMLTVTIKEELTKLVQNKNIFNPGVDSYLNSYLSQEKYLINKYLPDKKILIISTDDTYLLYLTNKVSFLNINPLTAAINQNDIDFSLQEVYKECPKTIAVDCSAIGKCAFFWKLNYLQYPYQIILDRINQYCHLQYTTQQCTSQLCIATAK